MAKLVLENVTKVFTAARQEPVRAVADLSLEVQSGELLALVGPSGSGKTTLLRLIAGLEQVTRGSILISGRNANTFAPQDRGVAMVFQQPALYPQMTVHQNIAFGLKIRKVPASELGQRVAEAAERMGVSPLLGRFPHSLSGGERQRVAVARAIVQRPQILLFDEPLSSVDAPTRLQLRREISKLQLQLRATTIYVTHDQSEAMAIGNRVAVLNRGGIEQIADPPQLYRKPQNLFVAGFIGSPPMNFFSGCMATAIVADPTTSHQLFFKETARDGTSSTDAFELRLPSGAVPWLNSYVGRPLILGIRPEAIAVKESSTPNDSDASIDAVVELVEHLGADTYLYLKSARHAFTCRVPPSCDASVGEKLRVRFALDRAHFFDPENQEVIRSF